ARTADVSSGTNRVRSTRCAARSVLMRARRNRARSRAFPANSPCLACRLPSLAPAKEGYVMTRRAVHGTIALVLSAGLMSSAMTADAAQKPRVVAAVTDKITENAKLAPKYEPAPPANLEQFTVNPNVQSVHFDFDRARIRAADAKILDGDVRWLKANP